MKKILIVEENPTMRKSIVTMLGYMNPPSAITEASDGDDAVNLLTHQDFDLVFTGYQMNGSADGLAVTAIARKSLPQSTIVFMTGDGGCMKDIAFKSGANHFFSKGPDSLVTLLGTIGFTMKPSPTHP